MSQKEEAQMNGVCVLADTCHEEVVLGMWQNQKNTTREP